MRNGNKKFLLIGIIIAVILIIVGAIFAYLFIATDTFKSDKELFGKYISQNIETLKQFTNSNMYNTYKNAKIGDVYESETNIKFSNSEGGEVSNPINDLSFKVTEKRDKLNEYMYADAQVLFKDEQYLKAEAIKSEDIYGIRFSNVVKQFVSVRNDENLSEVAEELEIKQEDFIKIFEILDGTTSVNEEILSSENISELQNKYLEIITNNISNGTYSKLKKAMITVNNNTIQTNAYTVNLTGEQVQNTIIQILEAMKTDTIILEKIENFTDEESYIETLNQYIDEISANIDIPGINITVYEQGSVTVRTVVELGVYKIVIDNSQQEGNLITNIQINELDSEQEKQQNIEISKQINDNQEIYSISMKIINGEDSIEISLSSYVQENNVETTISYIDGIETTSLIIENSINTVDSIEDVIKLDRKNNVVLNDLDSEKRKTIINLLEKNVPAKTTKRIQLLSEALNSSTDSNQGTQTEPTEMSQTDINKFNAKFEYYTGNAVSAQNVKILLDTVKNNISSVEITPIENEDDENTNQEEIKENIKLNIEKDKTNEELINSLLTKIKDDAEYKVTISYKDTNGIIDYINIREVEE